MPPITKFWLSTLKDKKSTDSPEFTQLLADILTLCSSYTNPDTASPRMHALYQDINNPAQLVMITGYPSQELNTEADKFYAAKYLPRMFEHVQHVWLKQLDIDVTTLHLDDDRLVVTHGTAPSTWKDGKSPGGLDVWQKTRQALDNENGARGVEILDNPVDADWLQVSTWDGGAQNAAKPEAGGVFYPRKVMGR
ncbi:hypothetical protein NUU61_002645 [Penicillium alfredii]|uniref:Uncharacterized protein n=1 Tax=Penicillium alfredii TaxID=1506179 RepID=A0A9W9KH34_9EURO|nr:uncharacterized protein NUU61_002645 [Penicillium alfredii]KAJ5105298.1 hypothetical protein NUU61_002645 [Penicillium alfredii]